MFDTKEQEIIKYGLANGKSKEEVQQALTNYRLKITPKTAQPQQPSDMGADIKQIATDNTNSINKRADTVSQAQVDYHQGKQGLLRTAEQVIGQGAGVASDIIGNIFKGVVKAVLPQRAENAVKGGIQSVTKPIVESEVVKNVISKYNSLDEKTKRDIDSALGIVSLGTDITGIEGGVKLAGKALKVGKETLNVAKQGTKDAIAEVKATGTKISESGLGQIGKDIGERIPRAGKNAKEVIATAAEKAALIKKSTPEVGNALKVNLDKGIIDTVIAADKTTAKSFKNVIDIAEQSAKGGIRKSPTIVGGELASEQYDIILKEKNAIGKQLGETTKALSKDTTISMQDSFKAIDDTLANQGIDVIYTKKGTKLNFTGSKYTPTERTKIQELYNLATEGGDNLSPLNVREKDQLFSKLQREARMEGVGNLIVDTPQGSKSLFSVFRDIYSSKLDGISPEIKALNAKYSQYAKLTDDIENSILKTPNFNVTKVADPAEFAKVNLRRIFGEAQSSPVYEEVANAMDSAARELGYKGATPKQVAQFAEQIRSLYPEIIPKTGFQGGINTSVRGAINKVTGKVMEMGVPRLKDQQKALRDLIESLIKKTTVK